MSTVLEWLRSTGRRLRGGEHQEERPADAETTPRDHAPASMFRCRECQTIYIAAAKDSCFTCDAPVERLPPAQAATA